MPVGGVVTVASLRSACACLVKWLDTVGIRTGILDAVAHMVRDGEVHPGRPVGECVTMGGDRHGATTAFAAGIVTRGVLLDLASDGPVPADRAITAQDLGVAEERHGVRVESGDAYPPLREGGPPAMHGVALPLPGMPLVDAVDADGLAAVCAELGRHSFLFVAAPPRIHGLIGVPVNPLAIF
jgi:hypothetical protein